MAARIERGMFTAEKSDGSWRRARLIAGGRIRLADDEWLASLLCIKPLLVCADGLVVIAVLPEAALPSMIRFFPWEVRGPMLEIRRPR